LLDWINYTHVWGIETSFELTIVNRYGTTEDERNALQVIGKGKNIASIKLPTPDDASKLHLKARHAESSVKPTLTEQKTLQQQAYEMFHDGVNVKSIAKALNKSKTTIYRYLHLEHRRREAPPS
jgi:hypothetical protein